MARFGGAVQLDNGLIIPTSAANGTAAVGKVLTSDASGNAAWATVTGVQFVAAIGDGASTTITVTHNLGTRDVDANVYEASGAYRVVDCSIAHPTTNTATFTFGSAPSAGQYRAVIQAGGLMTGMNSIAATVDFGSVETDSASVTVTAPWVTASTILVVTPFAGATADHDPEDYVLEGLDGYATNIVAGVSFDILATAPNSTWGKYLINAIGVG